MDALRQARTIAMQEPSQVAVARRVATESCHALGLAEPVTQDAELVACELATNLLAHAGGGTMFFSGTAGGALQMIASDLGRGIVDVQRALEDGFTTGSTLGVGLGTVRRKTQTMDVWSQPGAGTVVAVTLGVASRTELEHCAAVCTAIEGETVSGDTWCVYSLLDGQRTVYLVADGLGHGAFACEAAAMAQDVARRAFEQQPQIALSAVLERMHGPLRATRGAAVSLVSVQAGVATGCGVGNVTSLIRLPDGTPRTLIAHNGTVGHQMRRVQEFTQAVPEDSLLFMHSDGLSARWKLESYPGLAQAHPATVAAVLYRDAQRGRDDATMLVARLHHSEAHA